MSEQDVLILARIVKRLLDISLYGFDDPRAPKFGEGYEMSQTVQAMIERLEAKGQDDPDAG